MMPPNSTTNVVLQLRREEALDVLAYARDLLRLRRHWENLDERPVLDENDEDDECAAC